MSLEIAQHIPERLVPSNARNVNGRRMSFQSLDELRRVLLELELVAPDQLAIAVDEVASVWRQPGPLLDLLERQGLLTTYQLSKLHKGETDGLVLGRYKLLYRNNSGSFARVFRACSLDDGKMVGLKVLRQRWASDPNYVKQFHREAEICQRLRHKNIVPIYDVGEDRGEHFLTMEFVEGGNLREFLKIRGQCSLIESAQCLLDMAEGLEYALSKGITHRDFKLTNVLMSTDRVAKLVDFGLASLNSTESGTDEGNLLALEYATLEKGTGAPDDDPRSDLFFLGGAVYELLTGSPPYPATKDRSERKQLSRYTNVRQLRSIAPHVPAALSEIVDNLMRVNPNERFQSATEVVHATRKAFKELGSIPRGQQQQQRPEDGPVHRNSTKASGFAARLFDEDRLPSTDDDGSAARDDSTAKRSHRRGVVDGRLRFGRLFQRPARAGALEKIFEHSDGGRAGSKPTRLEKHAGGCRFDAGLSSDDSTAGCSPRTGISAGCEVRMSDRKSLAVGESRPNYGGALILDGVP